MSEKFFEYDNPKELSSLDLQRRFESGELKESDMTPYQRQQLLGLYKKQINGLDDGTYTLGNIKGKNNL